MAESSDCWGHELRSARRKKIIKPTPAENPNENLRVLIKKGPVSVHTSLKDLEENYASKPEWKLVEEGGVLSIPVEEFRTIDLPRPDHSGKVDFGKRKKEQGKRSRITHLLKQLEI